MLVQIGGFPGPVVIFLRHNFLEYLFVIIHVQFFKVANAVADSKIRGKRLPTSIVSVI
jgi:hypothetical protein